VVEDRSIGRASTLTETVRARTKRCLSKIAHPGAMVPTRNRAVGMTALDAVDCSSTGTPLSAARHCTGVGREAGLD
jgi:hypothetical protein